MTGFTLIGDPELNRTQLFAHAARAEGSSVDVLPYSQIMEGLADWPARLAGRCVRLESPGRDFGVELALLARGDTVGVEPLFTRVPAATLRGIRRDPGQILATRQWYLGWCDLLEEIGRAGTRVGARFVNPPADIAVMFDKVACHARLSQAGVPTPRALPPPASFGELMEALRAAGWSRAFLKASHGSAANGVVALAWAGNQIQAHTAIEVATTSAGAPRLYSTRRLRVYRDASAVRRLVDALCGERLHVEAWVPKAGIAGRTADARVVVIGGRACHLVLRLARGPITNLHLGALKGDEEMLARVAGDEAVALLRRTAERAAACFPASLCVGVDLALTPRFRQAVVLEVNAFGDLLEDVMWQGADTYTWQVRAIEQRNWPPADERQVSCCGA